MVLKRWADTETHTSRPEVFRSEHYEQNPYLLFDAHRGVALEVWAQGPVTGNEVLEGARVKSGRAGTIGLMLKSCQTWGCRLEYLATLGVPGSPRHPRWRRPWPRKAKSVKQKNKDLRRHAIGAGDSIKLKVQSH